MSEIEIDLGALDPARLERVTQTETDDRWYVNA